MTGTTIAQDMPTLIGTGYDTERKLTWYQERDIGRYYE